MTSQIRPRSSLTPDPDPSPKRTRFSSPPSPAQQARAGPSTSTSLFRSEINSNSNGGGNVASTSTSTGRNVGESLFDSLGDSPSQEEYSTEEEEEEDLILVGVGTTGGGLRGDALTEKRGSLREGTLIAESSGSGAVSRSVQEGEGEASEREPTTEPESEDDFLPFVRPSTNPMTIAGPFTRVPLVPIPQPPPQPQASSSNTSPSPRRSIPSLQTDLTSTIDLTKDDSLPDLTQTSTITPSSSSSSHNLAPPSTSSTSSRTLSLTSTLALNPAPAPPPHAPRRATSPPPPPLSHLTCPICLGPPTPLAITACGHAFCAGCLHEALVAGGRLTPEPLVPMGGGRFNRDRRDDRREYQPLPVVPRAGEGESELDAHCPVCRFALRGGWGKSLRGITLRTRRKTVGVLLVD